MGGSLVRLRWRLYGAWMWPSFIGLTIVDGVITHALPLSGDSESAIGGALLGLFFSLVGIIVLAPILAIALRRVRTDMPKAVARDYAGTAVIATVTAILLIAGLIHHPAIGADQRALQDATARAQAYIGDRAPAPFRENLQDVNTYELQGPNIFRACVVNVQRTRTYCVVVNRSKPFDDSVTFAGYESNAVLEQGNW